MTSRRSSEPSSTARTSARLRSTVAEAGSSSLGGAFRPGRVPRTRGGAGGRGVGRAGRRRVLGADTSVTQPVLRLTYHPGHTHAINAAFLACAKFDGTAPRPGRSFDIREA